ncbi:CHAT domain-containing protein [Aerosakkonema funiforme]|uniref:CHAT domain-containing protein n=1 Tax=Aerosakkonema funiforme FACHB-1375 TaxID=2949571 RepID=A0A926VGT6_9CYAN|nr:CHAT domain-containing protein [Aerosakkonema funiforme]MBD2182369.1 CHAT domain-containing protein [Aerosakkonema funiforme FACHB-1375]
MNLKKSLLRSFWNIGLGCLALFSVTVMFPYVTYPNDRVPIAQQTSAPRQLVEQGRELYQAGRYQDAIALWQQAAKAFEAESAILPQVSVLNYLSLAYQDLGQAQLSRAAVDRSLQLLKSQGKLNRQGLSLLGQALNAQGNLQIKTGQTQAALDTWIQAESAYKQAANQTGIIGSSINQAQALRILGNHRQARSILQENLQEIQTQPDNKLKASGLRSLGIALQLIGDLRQSYEVLKQSLAVSRSTGNDNDRSATFLDIGNVAREYGEPRVALDYYQKAAQISSNPLLQTQALVNLFSLRVEENKTEEAIALLPEIESKIASLTVGRQAIYIRVNFAESLMKLAVREPKTLPAKFLQEIATSLGTAVQLSRQLQDSTAEAYALDRLSQLYAQQEQTKEAQTLAQQAFYIAKQTNSNELIARTAWQVGHLLKQQGKREEAIAAYQEAFKALQALRSDLIGIDSDIQLNFTKNVEPIHREFVDLLLQENATQDDLKTARQVIEALQLAELDNFFQDACLDANPVQIDQIDPTAAVIYPIILADRIEVILSIPDRPLRHYATKIPKAEMEKTLKQLYSSLNPEFSDKERLRYAQEVFNWLIQPAKTDLKTHNIKTLIFIPDGLLRNIPMAALYDGKQYLIEQYAVVLSSGLQLLEPQTLNKEQLNALTAGLTEARQGFSALPSVAHEVKQIALEINVSKLLLNKQFTRTALKNQIEAKPFRVVHLATHGQFSSNPEETFLLTWDGRINVKELDELLQIRGRSEKDPIELLVLSACQTANGDLRATLGLAGVALRSGARSTLATLWSVRDESTAQLMIEFYRQLTNTPSSKANALRQAQLNLLRHPSYNHPFFWSPFVLVGNWL